MNEFPQSNLWRVDGVTVKACRCGARMRVTQAWWWTWHGATCSEGCARDLIAEFHGKGQCDVECRL